jgi:hypothetical protein
LACCVIVGVVYFTQGRDPLAFVLMGERYASGQRGGVRGYDGQFAYYIATDPVGALAHLDNPPYRYQRLLYPLLARVLSLGRPAMVPWALVLINVISLSLSTEVLGRMLVRWEMSAYLALLMPFWLGQVFALRADLNEPLCFLLVVLALWWYEQELPRLSAGALAASALAKEVGLLFLPPILLVMVLRRQWRAALHYSLIGSVPYMLLQVLLHSFMGRSGLTGTRGLLGSLPFFGFTFSDPSEARLFLVVVIVAPVSGLLVLAVRQILETPRSVYAWALLINCLFIAILPRRTTIDVLAVFRVTTGVIVAALLFCAAHGWRRVAWALHAIWLPPSILALMIPGFLV